MDKGTWEEVVEEPARAPSPRHYNQSSSPIRHQPSIDDLEELPTDPDLFESLSSFFFILPFFIRHFLVLCNCPLIDLEEGDRAYIQDRLDNLQDEILIGQGLNEFL